MAIEVQGREFKAKTINGIDINGTNKSIALTAGGNSLASNKITTNLNGKTIIVGLTVHTAFASIINSPVSIEGSMDGTNWGQVEKIDNSSLPSTLGTRFYTVDLTNHTSIPYIRIHFNGGAGTTPVTVGTSGLVSFEWLEVPT